MAAKHLRYTLEIFGPLAGAEWEQEIGRIREMQEFLGAVNDCVSSIGLIEEYGHEAETRGLKILLRRLLKKRLAAFRKHWRSSLKAGDKRRSPAPQSVKRRRSD